MIVAYIIVLLLSVICLVGISSLCVYFLSQTIAMAMESAPQVWTPKDALPNILHAFQFNSDSVFYDLGCGSGRILNAVTDAYSIKKAVGIEIAVFPYLLAKFNTRNKKNVYIQYGNMFNADISDATHIYMYLFPKPVNELMEKFTKECKPGTLVFTTDFKLSNYEPVQVIDITKNRKSLRLGETLYIYKI